MKSIDECRVRARSASLSNLRLTLELLKAFVLNYGRSVFAGKSDSPANLTVANLPT